MLDIGPGVSDDKSLLAVVDRLGAAGSDRVAARAYEQVRRAVLAQVPLPGLRRLTANLAAVDAGELPPPPRCPADEPGSVVAAVRDNPLMILDDVEPAEVAAAVAALVEDGRRVIVTAEDTAALGTMRSMLPEAVTDRIVGALPTLAPVDVHRLRGLLATSTPARRARTAQQLPDLAAFPDADTVAQLCVTALRSSAPGVEVIADVLGELDADRRGAVSAIAQCVQRSLQVLSAHSEPWIWDLLADLVVGRRRSEFDRLVLSTAQALSTIDDGRGDPPGRWTRSSPISTSSTRADAHAATSGHRCSATSSPSWACCASATTSPRPRTSSGSCSRTSSWVSGSSRSTPTAPRWTCPPRRTRTS
jgi:hypothetical protein